MYAGFSRVRKLDFTLKESIFDTEKQFEKGFGVIH